MQEIAEVLNTADKSKKARLDAQQVFLEKRSEVWQRDLLFSALRDREVFPGRAGQKFCCCPKCTAKLYECVVSRVFRYIDNAKWKAEIESGRGTRSEA